MSSLTPQGEGWGEEDRISVRCRRSYPPNPILACRTRVFPSSANYDCPSRKHPTWGGEDRPRIRSGAGSLPSGEREGPGRSAAHQRAAAVLERTEGFGGRNGRPNLVIVPRIFGLFPLLRLEQIHVVDLSAFGADRALADQLVVGRHLFHLVIRGLPGLILFPRPDRLC